MSDVRCTIISLETLIIIQTNDPNAWIVGFALTEKENSIWLNRKCVDSCHKCSSSINFAILMKYCGLIKFWFNPFFSIIIQCLYNHFQWPWRQNCGLWMTESNATQSQTAISSLTINTKRFFDYIKCHHEIIIHKILWHWKWMQSHATFLQ